MRNIIKLAPTLADAVDQAVADDPRLAGWDLLPESDAYDSRYVWLSLPAWSAEPSRAEAHHSVFVGRDLVADFSELADAEARADALTERVVNGIRYTDCWVDVTVRSYPEHWHPSPPPPKLARETRELAVRTDAASHAAFAGFRARDRMAARDGSLPACIVTGAVLDRYDAAEARARRERAIALLGASS